MDYLPVFYNLKGQLCLMVVLLLLCLAWGVGFLLALLTRHYPFAWGLELLF